MNKKHEDNLKIIFAKIENDCQKELSVEEKVLILRTYQTAYDLLKVQFLNNVKDVFSKKV